MFFIQPPNSAFNAGYNQHEADLAKQRKVDSLKQQHEDFDRKEPKDLQRTKNVTGPPVYYPPEHELFAKKEESGAWRAEVSIINIILGVVGFIYILFFSLILGINFVVYYYREQWRENLANTSMKLKVVVNPKPRLGQRSFLFVFLYVVDYHALSYNIT